MPQPTRQLLSYIAPAAPATRRPAEGDEPFLRPEIGFTPAWYRGRLGVDFGERWHRDPAYRRETVRQMRAELGRAFPGTAIGGIDRPDAPLDLLTGTYGATLMAAVFGVKVLYAEDQWPTCEVGRLNAEQIDALEPPDLDASPAWRELMDQVDWIAEHEGRVEGFINFQGVLNNAHRLRGEGLFYDLFDAPERCRRLFECVCETMIRATRRLHERQRETGVDVRFATVSNCLVNMISPEQYREFLLPHDRRIAETFGCIGIHNCAWNANPYLDDYATVPNVGYIDMGTESDLPRAKARFPHARRAIMYTPMDLANKTEAELRADVETIASQYGPCDLVLADIEADTPDDRVHLIRRLCE